MSDIDAVLRLARPDILGLTPYAHAAWAPSLVRLHANELPWPGPDVQATDVNRYPEPQPADLAAAFAAFAGVQPAQVLVTHGSDEAIDLLTRAFCRAREDAVIVTPPTFGMFSVAARIQGADVIEVPLAGADFLAPTAALIAALEPRIKIVWLCSPNNPTGGRIPDDALAAIIAAASGRALVVIDEAYVDFDPRPSRVPLLAQNPHLVILRTLSKAHGLAGARIGAVLAHPQIIGLLRRIVAPYNLSRASIASGLAALQPAALQATRERVQRIVAAREQLRAGLAASRVIDRVWPSAGNFLLVRCRPGTTIFDRWLSAGLLVRDFRRTPGLADCLRITVGDDDQNARLLAVLGSET